MKSNKSKRPNLDRLTGTGRPVLNETGQTNEQEKPKMFNYIHNESLTVNTELGSIKLTYIVAAQLPRNILGERDTPQGMEACNSYWQAFLDKRGILAHGVTAEQAVKEVYKIEAIQRFNNLDLDLP